MGFPPTPTGAVGGVLSGTLPNPGAAVPFPLGSGDSQSVQTMPIVVTAGKYQNVLLGSAATPDTALIPPIKISRLFHNVYADISPSTSDASENLSGISVNVVADSTSQLQAVGVYGVTANSGTSKGSSDSPDACGLYGVGRIKTGGIGVGMGAFVFGRKETGTTGYVNGIQVATRNDAADSSYSSSGFSDSAVWIAALGTGGFKTAAAILVGNPAGNQYDVGLAFNGQVAGGKTGGIVTASIQDDSQALTSVVINGTHQVGIDLSGGTFTGGNGTPLLLPNNKNIKAMNAAGSGVVNILAVDSTDHVYFPTTTTFNANVTFNDGFNLAFASTTGTKIGTATNQKLSFWNKTPIVQPTTGISGAANTNPGTGTAITSTSTFGGYTLAQLAAVIINTGLAA